MTRTKATNRNSEIIETVELAGKNFMQNRHYEGNSQDYNVQEKLSIMRKESTDIKKP